MLWHEISAQTLKVNALTSYCYKTDSPILMSDIVSVEGAIVDRLEGIQITIKEGYEPGVDQFQYTTADGINATFDSGAGIMTLNGSGTIDQYNKALERLNFITSADQSSPKTLNVTLSGIDFLVSTGHFYQFFSETGIRWDDAKNAAEQKELFGLKGYLTTITTAAENSFILNRVSGTAWIGASDEAQEGEWRWVTGPEGLALGGAGRLLSSSFTNWETGEPNNAGPEHFAHMMDWSTPPGRWNDLAVEGGGGNYTATGYIVEYGGMPGDPNVIDNISADIMIDPEKVFGLSGSVSVCPNIEGVVYTTMDAPNHNYDWQVSGGDIVSGQGTFQIMVNWGTTNASASVQVDISSDVACVYQQTLNVKVNEKLEPPLPNGNQFVCYTDIGTPQPYSTPFTAGSTYVWKPKNGIVVEGQGTNKVSILWDGTADGELYFTESTSTASDICDGDSPIKAIDIRPEIESEITLSHVSCFNGSDGSASIQVSIIGSVLNIDWQTGGIGLNNGNEITQLPTGDYSVDITLDDCLINIPFTITEPTELVGSTETENVLCFGESNGIATALVNGGTGDYRYSWSHDSNATGAVVNNLPVGNHSVEVQDEKNCILILNFEILEPELLEIPSIVATVVSCPGGSDGTLRANVAGGTMPYTYEWVGLGQTEQTATGLTKGEYQVIVTDANGCTEALMQTVTEAIPKVILPNAFTPNKDGMNDTFGPTTPCDIRFRMEIYNRWGETLFTTNSSTNQWDGTFKGRPVPDGKYSFVASWVVEANELIITDSKKGEISLMR